MFADVEMCSFMLLFCSFICVKKQEKKELQVTLDEDERKEMKEREREYRKREKLEYTSLPLLQSLRVNHSCGIEREREREANELKWRARSGESEKEITAKSGHWPVT